MTPVLEKPYISVSINPENIRFLHFTNGGHTQKSIMATPMFLRIKRSMQTSNLQKLNWYISTKHIYVSDEYNIWKSPLGNYKKNTINIYHLLIFNKLLTSSEHRNRNKPLYIYKGLIQWKKADPASTPWPMYMHESNAIHIQRSSRASA